MKINEEDYGKNKDQILIKFQNEGIESRPVWRLNNLQKPYVKCQTYDLNNSYKLVQNSLCLPSNLNLNKSDYEKIIGCLDE